MRTFRKWITGATGAAVIAGGSLLAGPAAFASDPEDPVRTFAEELGHGHTITPGQNEHWQNGVWLGSFVVGGEQAWCVQFGLESPDRDEEYEPAGELTDKWGDPLPEDVASMVSYMLLRHGETTSDDEAAAVAHLLHAATSSPGDTETGDMTEVAYDIGYHQAQLDEKHPEAAELVATIAEGAERNRGPWTASMSAPVEPQTIGQAGEWSIEVVGAEGQGISGVPVTLNVTDVEVEGLAEDGSVTTPEDGSPLRLQVTPTGPAPSITGELVAPTAQPKVQRSVQDPEGTQRLVSTGGEETLTVEAAAEALTPQGEALVVKTDEQNQAGIAGASFRVTGADGGPAKLADGTELVGENGEPAVVTTTDDGTVAVPGLAADQRISITEVGPATGYEESFDPAAAPSATGTVESGRTLELALTNKANTPTVPVHIPAGDPVAPNGEVVELRASENDALSGGLIGFGALALAGAAVGGGLAYRRALVAASRR